jgi:hypothetical protein
MYAITNELASHFSLIGENLQKMREAIAKGLFQDALLLASEVNSSTRQLAVEVWRS